MKNTTSLLAGAAAVILSACGTSPAEPEGTKRLELDGQTVTWIKENAGDKLMPVSLFPEASAELLDSLGLQDGIPSTISVFLLEKNGKKILFDTGTGSDDSRLIPSLKALGSAPEDIDYLYITHFHGDHIGGMVKAGQKVFTNAEVYVPKAEYDAWMAMPEDMNALVVECMAAYKDRLHLFAAGDVLPCDVLAIDAAGHTPGHTVYRSGDLLVAGDIMHGVALQIGHPWICPQYDMDPAQAVIAREKIMAYADSAHLVMAGMHFPEPAFIFPEQE